MLWEGGIAVIVCDALKKKVIQGHSYTYLAIGDPISPGTLRAIGPRRTKNTTP